MAGQAARRRKHVPEVASCQRTGNERGNKVEVVDEDKDEHHHKAEKVAPPRLVVLSVANGKRLQERNDVVLGDSLRQCREQQGQ